MKQRSPRILRRRLEVEPLSVAAALSGVEGTLLLRDQRPVSPRRTPSALLFDPRWIVELDAHGGTRSRGDAPRPPDDPGDLAHWPLRLTRPWRALASVGPHPFTGVAGYLGYDLGPARWGSVHPVGPPFQVPDLWLAAYDAALVFDGAGTCDLVVADLSPIAEATSSLPLRWEQARSILEDCAEQVSPGETPAAKPAATRPPHFFSRRWHRQAVERVQRHLRAGDIYQANLTAFASAETTVSPFDVFLAQARTNPVGYAAFLRLGGAAITCHSPERLLRLRDDRASTAPIKGTWPGSADALPLLRSSEKDLAEHVMIVDLCRNDLGRSAVTGSVNVRELFSPLELTGLLHLVSHIESQTDPAHRHRVLGDLFPGGSITGAPKRRAMEIISAVERSRRGPYTGSIGYVDCNGDADWNIAIRTAVWQNGYVHFGCGGGIVLDSDPDREYDEARLKAASFFTTLDSLATTAAASASPTMRKGRAGT